MLVSFRGSLMVVPQHPDDYNRVLSLARTESFWAGLRRVYFGEQEVISPEGSPAPALTHDEVMIALSTDSRVGAACGSG
jgi:hypothetical protein